MLNHVGPRARTAFVATGRNYPDALTAGVAAAQDPTGGVVLLSDGTTLPPAVAGWINAHADPCLNTIYAVGGPAASAYQGAAMKCQGGHAFAVVGADRYQTAYLVATHTVFGAGSLTSAGVATGNNWPDALSGGALTGQLGGPLLLADTGGLSSNEERVLTGNRLTELTFFGGTAVIPEAVLSREANIAFGAGSWDEETNRLAPPVG